eukprot:3958611-Amphidinium_carterae.1
MHPSAIKAAIASVRLASPEARGHPVGVSLQSCSPLVWFGGPEQFVAKPRPARESEVQQGCGAQGAEPSHERVSALKCRG